MQRYFRSERYMRLMAIVRAGDVVTGRKIVDQAIAETEGAERAFWFLARAGGRINLPAPPVAAIMADIRTALAIAPADVALEQAALLNVLGLAIRAEQVEDGARWVAMLHRVMREEREPFMLRCNLATLQWRRMRPRAAIRQYSQALTGMYSWDADVRQANLIWLYRAHCYRALCAVEAGMSELAARDVAAVATLRYPADTHGDYLLRLAEASLALSEGEISLARQRLQLVRLGERATRCLRTAHPIRAEVEVTAARIALVEGNRPAFAYFMGRAMAIAREHRLDLTARRIEAIRTRALATPVAAQVE